MIFILAKMTKGSKTLTKRGQKEAKKSINRSWQLIITIADLEIDSGDKTPPLPKIVILGATVDETNFHLDQVSTNSPI